MKVSELIGSIIKNTDGSVCGYVCGVYSRENKIEYLACADGSEREFKADFRDVKLCGGEVIFNDRKTGKASLKQVRLGIPAYSEEGKFLGFISEVNIQRGNITNYVIGGKRYSPATLNVADAAIVKRRRTLKEDVVKNGTVIIKKGTEVTAPCLQTAQNAGEYIQTQLKSL
ncbi:MAG: hypothetical protein LUD19_06965 [Clostridia bacterium]|nr:hypothetical protein [Clostridia bacterium]